MIAEGSIAAELRAGARYLGGTLLLTQGAGGNNSVKDVASDTLWIKASGINLSKTSDNDAFVALCLSETQRIVRDLRLRSMPSAAAQELSTQRFLASVRSSNRLRPSLETGMHVSLPHKAVLHTHSVYLNAFACMQGGGEAAATHLPDHAWVRYATPGLNLALAVAEIASSEPRKPLAIMLENHGFIAAAPSVEQAIALSEQFVHAARDFFGELDVAWGTLEQPSPEISGLARLATSQSASGSDFSVRPGRFGIFRAAAGVLHGCASSAFVPDDVVYLGPRIWCAPTLEQAAALIRRIHAGCSRFVIAIPQHGILFGAEHERLLDGMEESALAHVLITMLISRRGVPSPMTESSVQEIVSMESEKYRQSVAGIDLGKAAQCRS